MVKNKNLLNITITQNDEKTDVRSDGTLIGYVEENALYGIDKEGYAQYVCDVFHRSEILPKLKKWLKNATNN